MAAIYQVSPWHVEVHDGLRGPSPRDVRTQRERLENEGQIEPLEVRPMQQDHARYPYLLRSDGWFYAEAQVAAARELGWPTILVTY